jgi:rhodanese-related sulfurtransferase
MGLIEAVKKALGRAPIPAAPASAPRDARSDAAATEEVRVPEVSSTELLAELASRGEDGPLLLDIREPYERAHSLIPGSMHIPMNSIPSRLAELDPNDDIVVYCAHGNRSYGVTGWLIQQGYHARSLKGGIVDWQHHRGPVESGYRARG